MDDEERPDLDALLKIEQGKELDLETSLDLLTELPNQEGSSRWDGVWKYVSDRQRLKAVAVLGGTIAGMTLLKEQKDLVEEFCRTSLPFLTEQYISLIWDIVVNGSTAWWGYVIFNYANDEQITREELAGQIAFAFAWGAVRHYVYEGLDNVGDADIAGSQVLKGTLYTLYSATYVGLYTAFSDGLHKVSQGESFREAFRGVKDTFKKKYKAMFMDGTVQYNVALNLFNIFLTWEKLQPTVASALLVKYNMDILKHSHDKQHNFFDYLKKIVLPNRN